MGYSCRGICESLKGQSIPNVYEGWIQQTVDECGKGADPCSKEIADYLKKLDKHQKDPLGNPDNDDE